MTAHSDVHTIPREYFQPNSKEMLNLSFVFDEANEALRNHAAHLQVMPLPAAVFMMQQDVINHYRHALQHFLTLTLNEPFLQDSSLGTPYQKWMKFTNADFRMLSFAIHNLLRYTSRLVHLTTCAGLRKESRFSEMKDRSNRYTSLLGELRHREKPIGITIEHDQQLSLVPVPIQRETAQAISRGNAGEPTRFFRIVTTSFGQQREEPISAEEWKRMCEWIKTIPMDIRDRSRLKELKQLGLTEIHGLAERNMAFGELCCGFYQSPKVAVPFQELNEAWWV